MNKLKPDNYLSQRNNRLKPKVACNVTSMIMGAFQAGYHGKVMYSRDRYNAIMNTNFLQPEDALMDFINSDKYRSIAKGGLSAYRDFPEQSFDALVKGTNDFIGMDVFRIAWHETIDTIKDKISKGFGVIICGDFPGTYGHFVNVGGYHGEIFVINDPYGDYKTGYKEKDGYNVLMPEADFRDIVYGNFWVFYGSPLS